MKPKLTITDVRAAGFCVLGVRRHYEGLGLSVPFRDFLREGIDLDLVSEIDDAHVRLSVEFAKKRINSAKGPE